MPRIVIFDENVTPQRVLKVTGRSENQGAWDDSGRTDYVVDPDLSSLDGVPVRDWKHEDGGIVEWTQAEKDARSTAEAAGKVTDAAAVLAQIRSEAAAGLDGFDREPLLLRAFAAIVLDEINRLRDEHGLEHRTLAQLRAAISSRVESGDVDA